jgi:CheY-like chemotaxis protein
MIVSSDPDSLVKNSNQIIIDYCRINQRSDEIQFICDGDSEVLAYASNKLVEEALYKYFSGPKTINDLFQHTGDLINNAKGCMIHTQISPDPAFAKLLHSLGFDVESVDATLYPVFQTPVPHHLHNLAIQLKPQQPFPEPNDVKTTEDFQKSEYTHIPYCLIDSGTGLFLDCNDEFEELIEKPAETILRSRCDEIGLRDLLLMGSLNADRRCLFSAQLNTQSASRNWAIAQSVVLDDRPCLKLWCPFSNADTSHQDPFTDELAEAFLATWEDKPAKVLICDDNELLLDTCSSIMNWAQINYRVALNGKEALNLLENETFDVVFLDLNMPRLNGFDTARMIKQSTRSYSGVPLVAMTATPPSSMDRGRQLKYFDAVLQKPFDIEDIRQSVRAGMQTAKTNEASTRSHTTNEDPANSPVEAKDYEPTSFMFLFREQSAQLENLRNTILESLKKIDSESLDYHCRKQVSELITLLHKTHSMAKTMGATKLMKTVELISTRYRDATFAEKEQLFELFQQTLTETEAFYNTVAWNDFIPQKQFGNAYVNA